MTLMELSGGCHWISGYIDFLLDNVCEYWCKDLWKISTCPRRPLIQTTSINTVLCCTERWFDGSLSLKRVGRETG